MTNWTLALALWGACIYATGCEETDPVTQSSQDVDAGPVPCKEIKIECMFSDPENRTGWQCYWVELCDTEDARA